MRTCHHCGKMLPATAPRTQRFCPRQKGTTFCSELARRERLKAKGAPELDLAFYHRNAPPSAAGYRIRLKTDGGDWVGPRLGAKYHVDAQGHKSAGDFYKFGESPRVPKTADYLIDYVDRHGQLLLPLERAKTVSLTATGGDFRYRASPGLREKQARLDAGLPLPLPPRRLYAVAKDLGMTARELLTELSKLGITRNAIQCTLEPNEVDLILSQYAGRALPKRAPTPASLPASAPQPATWSPTPPAMALPSITPADVQLDECLPIPPLIQREHSMAHASVRAIMQSVEQVERQGMETVDRITSETEAMGMQVDIAAGLVPAPTK